MTTTEVENFPGFPEGISGPDLMMRFRKQAERFGTELIQKDVVRVEVNEEIFCIYTQEEEPPVRSRTLIVATGATARRLEVPGCREGELWQKGVSACAVCDGALPLFRNKKLYVIGGGDSAVEEALFLTKYAQQVYLVHRRDRLRASYIMAKRAQSHRKITILWNVTLQEVRGRERVEELSLQNTLSGKIESREAGGVFFAIGHTPNVSFLQGKVRFTPQGYIDVLPGSCKTSIPALFAAGDVQDARYRQAITAAGSGCMAALEAEQWLSERDLL